MPGSKNQPPFKHPAQNIQENPNSENPDALPVSLRSDATSNDLMLEVELGPPKADFSAPPPYEFANNQQQQEPQQNQLQMNSNTNPDDIPLNHGKLPTYEEVQMEKSFELPPSFIGLMPPMPPPPPPNPLLANIRGVRPANSSSTTVGGAPPLTFIAIDAAEADNLTNTDNSLLGTDIMFITAFMVAFLFNWIGFLMLTCFCHTIAARYGALSGFGLSLAKWTLIVKNSTDLASHENSWLWWLIMAFGFLICVRALIQYVSIKRTWRLLSTSAQERLLFFY